MEYVQQNVQEVHGLATKVNENLFAQIRVQVVTPDVVEFARCLPGAVENLQMRMSELPFYLPYKSRIILRENRELKEDTIPNHFPKQKKTLPIIKEERVLMTDYRMTYLEGVRQQSIRGQTTKDKAGTLPLYVYEKRDLRPSPLNFNDCIASGDGVDKVGVEVKFRKGQFFLISLTSERNILKLINDVHVDEYSMHVEIYNNDPLEFIVDQNLQISRYHLTGYHGFGERRW